MYCEWQKVDKTNETSAVYLDLLSSSNLTWGLLILVLSHWASFTHSSSEFKLGKVPQPSVSEVISRKPPPSRDFWHEQTGEGAELEWITLPA